MTKKADARGTIYLACPECKERNYTTTKNRKNDSQRLELNKYCPNCRVVTKHKETK
jgi:large subunit ribosomal protein L33